MKKTLTLIVALALGLTLMAQTPGSGNHRHHKRPEPPKVEEMVSNLSAVQKKKLETIAQDSKKQTENSFKNGCYNCQPQSVGNIFEVIARKHFSKVLQADEVDFLGISGPVRKGISDTDQPWHYTQQRID